MPRLVEQIDRIQETPPSIAMPGTKEGPGTVFEPVHDALR